MITMLVAAFMSAVVLSHSLVFAQLTAEELAAFSNDGAATCGGYVEIVDNGDDTLTINSAGLPDHLWECVNPNPPLDQSWSLTVPKYPEVASTPRCLPVSVIGFAKNGVPFYSPLTHLDRNAVEGGDKEDFDECGGHATSTGAYHYHMLPNAGEFADLGCANPIYDNKNTDSQFLGVALDGFPIYSQSSSTSAADLDACHGMMIDGRYTYIALDADYPYVMGCFKGDIIDANTRAPDCSAESSGNMLCQCVGESSEWQTECDVTCDFGDCDACEDVKRRSDLAEMLVRYLKHKSHRAARSVEEWPSFRRWLSMQTRPGPPRPQGGPPPPPSSGPSSGSSDAAENEATADVITDVSVYDDTCHNPDDSDYVNGECRVPGQP